MHFSKSDIKNLDRIKRLNIINSVTGVKPGNLIGSISNDGTTNLAIFSSVVHLGSDPALIGFIVRPTLEVPRHTYKNIKSNGSYTINHIPETHTEQAHYTSAKFEREVSEFDACGFTKEYIDDFKAPFVKESRLKMGLKFLESVPIEVNQTVMIIGQIEHVIIPDDALDEKGYIDLEHIQSAGISGLNSYYSLKKIDSYPYARRHEVPDFKTQ